jgi:hypothetical protein
LDVSSTWNAKVTATTELTGQSSISCSIEGGMVFNVYLSETASPDIIPPNSVVGRMVGAFEAQISTRTAQVSGKGNVEWTMDGSYDPVTETISVAIRTTGAGARGTETAQGDSTKSSTPVAKPFSMNWLSWGWQARETSWGGVVPWSEDASTILDSMKDPKPPVIPSDRESDLLLVHSLPQTGLNELPRLVLDLKDPEPQTIVQTMPDENGLGTRATTWVVALTPSFNIEREDRPTDGRNSFVSTDTIRLRMAIPGVTIAKSGWASLPSWGVKATGPFSGMGVPDYLPHSPSFGFEPNPGPRPTNGSTTRNRPLQYTVSATFEGIAQYFILIQDDVDLLRQEYIDHNERIVPSRTQCTAHPIDKAFNSGNYSLVVDGGMQAAFDKVNLEFGKESQGTLHVVSGFRSPQRNKASGDAHPGNPHVYGRALDLAPDAATAAALEALYRACVRAGYHSAFESAPGKSVPPGSPGAGYVHVDW